ncbi:MAG: glutathione-disulfide reductase, partial [Hyphomicrobium sp.]
MSSFDFDLFVIGAGSGGVRAARVAAAHGARVAIAEEDRFGGTCVIRGCVPKKLLVYASRFRDEFEDAAGFGWSVGETRFDWPRLIAAKDREIARLEAVYRGLLHKSGVRIFETRATLRAPHEVMLETEGYHVRARHILIATGGRPVKPDIPGAELAITSNEAFDLDALPASIAIVGGGYIAVEFACIFAGLGVEVTLLYRGVKILRGFDDDLCDGLTEAMRVRGIDVRTAVDVTAIAPSGDGYAATLSTGGALQTGLVMFATGRHPHTAGLGLEGAEVAVGPKGEIVVDAFSKSSVEGIHAVGDVTDRVNLTPVAIREGHALADTLFAGRPTAVDHSLIPTAVFTTPEVGTAGLSEVDARAAFGTVDIYKTRFRPMRNTLSGRDERMLMKLVVDAASGRVLGCHVLGPDAAEIVQMAAIALSMGATKTQFDATLALHPSAAEELVT